MRLLQEQLIGGVVVILLLAFGLLMGDESGLAQCWQNSLSSFNGDCNVTATVNHVDWSADGKTLMIEARNRDTTSLRLSIHPLGGQGYIPSWSESLKETLNHATLSPDGKSIVAATSSGELWWIDLETAAATELVTLTPKVAFRATAISRDGRLMAGSNEQGDTYLCDPRRGIEFVLPHSRHRKIHRLEFSDDSRRIVGLRSDGSIEVWDAETGVTLCRLDNQNRGAISGAAITPDGRSVLCLAGQDNFRIWDIETNAERWRGPEGVYGSSGIAAIDITSNGAVAAWGEAMTNKIVIWDLENQRVKYQIENPSMILNLRFSPDGNSLAVAGLEANVRIYDITTGKETHRIDVNQVHATNVRT